MHKPLSPITVAVAYNHPRSASTRDLAMFEAAVNDRMAQQVGREVLGRIPTSRYLSPGEQRSPCYVSPSRDQVAQVTFYALTREELIRLVEDCGGDAAHI